jgi:exopolysaccharide biosynthesis polyprenyl glycosylphosphotransferase
VLRYNLRYQSFLALCDMLVVLAALVGGSLLRLNIGLGMDAARETFITPPPLYLVAPLLFAAAYAQMGAYTVQPHARYVSVVRRVVTGHLFGTLLFLGALYLIFRDYSRLQAAYVVVLALAGVLGYRGVLAWVRARRTESALWHSLITPRNILIVGTSDGARRVGAEVRANAPAGLHLVGFVSVGESSADPHTAAHTPTAEPDPSLPAAPPLDADLGGIVGGVADLPRLVRAHSVHEVVIAVRWFDQAASDLVSHVMHLLEAEPVNIRLAPDYSELAYFRAHPEDFGGVTVVGLRENVLSPVQRIIKRTFDIVFSAAALVVLMPILLVVAVAIRLDSPGPALFVQPRIGQHGRRFDIYKFRTMYTDAEQIVPHSQAAEKGTVAHDPRITRVGAFLRRASIDELPQFWNVLRGEMSIVGPRPEVLWLAREYQWWQRKRFEVPQGLTGWWQVNGRSDRPMRFHIEDDMFYVRNYSLWLDLIILIRTIAAVFSGRGAY